MLNHYQLLFILFWSNIPDSCELSWLITVFLWQFFATWPLACDPSSLPKYPPSKEIDAKLRDEEARRCMLLKYSSVMKSILHVLQPYNIWFYDATSSILRRKLVFMTIFLGCILNGGKVEQIVNLVHLIVYQLLIFCTVVNFFLFSLAFCPL